MSETILLNNQNEQEDQTLSDRFNQDLSVSDEYLEDEFEQNEQTDQDLSDRFNQDLFASDERSSEDEFEQNEQTDQDLSDRFNQDLFASDEYLSEHESEPDGFIEQLQQTSIEIGNTYLQNDNQINRY